MSILSSPRAGARRLLRPTSFGLALATAVLAVGAFIKQPLTAPLAEKVEIAELTWVELRALVQQGHTTALVPSGGIEQNGPHLILGKHDRIVAHTARRIATSLGRTLVTPVVSFVPQGGYDPPTGHMRFPGTIGVPEEVFAGTLESIARSLKVAGFTAICFIADHGDSLPAQRRVAERLGREWASEGIKVVSVNGYTADAAQLAWLQSEGETPASIGRHGGIQDTSELMAAYPEGVKLDRWWDRPALSEPTGADGDPTRASPARGAHLLDMKVGAAVAEIRAAVRSGDVALRTTVAD